ncbi:MAG: glycoside hydrolase family 38 C-terminal domain-containing protein, partial [Terriglobia bacterium]
DLLTGFPTAEALIRSLYMSADFSRLHGTPFNYASIADVPSYSWSYASILAAAGIKYFIAGPNGHLSRAPVLIEGRLNEHSPFWWVGPDGGKVLFWYGRHYWEGGILFGVPPEVNAGRQTVPLFLKSYDRPSYRANAVILYGTQQENTDLFPQQAQLAGEWNRKFAYPRIRYSGFYAALKEIAAEFGSHIPTVRGDGGPYWEDGIASSARYASMERRNESRAPSAEKLATLSSLVNPRLAADTANLDRMWTNIVLMDEHTWNSHDSYSDRGSEENVRQQKVKEMYAINARQIADFVARNSMAGLANEIPVGRGSLIVFNTLNWKRSALVSFDLEKGREIADPATGAAVPFEVLGQSEHLLHVRFMAANVPAFGYKVYALRPSRAAIPTENATQTTTLESPYYRVALDPASGAVRSIYDKQLGRELVNAQSPYRFGQYLYVSGGDRRPNTLLQYRTIELEPKLQVDGAHGGQLLSVTRTPYGWAARMRSTDTNTPAITTELRLFENEKKIEFVEDIDKTAVRSREAVYFAFPFAMSHPDFQYEIQTGAVDPAKDMYPGAGHEWFSVQHWVSVQQDGLSGTVMPLDAALVTLGDIYRGAWPSHFGARPGTIFSYAMNNYWSTNYNAEQGGHLKFRYVITSAAATDDAALSRMGWEEATPLELDEVTRQDKAQVPGPGPGSEQASYLDVSDPDLLVEDWKTAENGDGTILRMIDLGGDTRQVTVTTPLLTLSHVIETDAVERNEHELPLAGPHSFQFTVHRDQIVTVRLVGEGGRDRSGS